MALFYIKKSIYTFFHSLNYHFNLIAYETANVLSPEGRMSLSYWKNF